MPAPIVRIRAADRNPAGPGQNIVDLGQVFRRTLPARVQTVALGFCGRIPHDEKLNVGAAPVT